MLPTFADIAETLEFLDDWEERYKAIIDYGRHLPPYPEELRDEAHKVRGCTSQVWLNMEWHMGADGVERLHLQGDSDAHIVKGLVAILLAFYHEATREEVRMRDINAAFTALGLSAHISPQRANGFFAMVAAVRTAAI